MNSVIDKNIKILLIVLTLAVFMLGMSIGWQSVVLFPNIEVRLCRIEENIKGLEKMKRTKSPVIHLKPWEVLVNGRDLEGEEK